MQTMTKKEQEKTADREVFGAQPAVARCAFCPDFAVEGTADEVMAAGVEHRATVHPGLLAKKTRRGKGRPCIVGLCEETALVTRGRHAGLCPDHRNAQLAEEKRVADEERHARRQAKLLEKQADVRPKTKRARTRRPRNSEPREHPLRLLTDEIGDEIVRMYQDGLSAIAIGRTMHEQWGYASADSLTACVYNVLRDRNVPRRSRSESVLLTLAREGPRSYTGPSQTMITDARLSAVSSLIEAGCSLTSIATLAWEPWGYASVESCRVAIRHRMAGAGMTVPRSHGMTEIPLVSRHEAVALVMESK